MSNKELPPLPEIVPSARLYKDKAGMKRWDARAVASPDDVSVISVSHARTIAYDYARAALAAQPDATTLTLIETFTEWARQVADRSDIPMGIRQAATGLQKQGLAALAAQPVAPKGWKQIGWTCDEGACGRIHDEPSTADPEFTQPVYVAVEASKPERKTLHVCTLECGDTYITSGSAEAEIGETPEVIESFDMPAFAVDLILKSLPEYDNG